MKKTTRTTPAQKLETEKTSDPPKALRTLLQHQHSVSPGARHARSATIAATLARDSRNQTEQNTNHARLLRPVTCGNMCVGASSYCHFPTLQGIAQDQRSGECPLSQATAFPHVARMAPTLHQGRVRRVQLVALRLLRPGHRRLLPAQKKTSRRRQTHGKLSRVGRNTQGLLSLAQTVQAAEMSHKQVEPARKFQEQKNNTCLSLCPFVPFSSRSSRLSLSLSLSPALSLLLLLLRSFSAWGPSIYLTHAPLFPFAFHLSIYQAVYLASYRS